MAAPARESAAFSEDPNEFLAFQWVPLPDVQEEHRLLFIGCREATRDVHELHKHNITHILSVMKGAQSLRIDRRRFKWLPVEAVDDPGYDLRPDWAKCCSFILEAREAGGGVLIHCEAGMSRSGATLVAFLIHHLRRPMGECLVLAQRARSFIDPNEGFRAQLLAWERDCLGQCCLPPGGRYMHEVRPRLWLGSMEAAEDWERLIECRITHVMCCARGLGAKLPAGVAALPTVAFDDLEEVDLLEHLPPTSDLLRGILADPEQRILVHCAAGRSRSASIVIAYTMREEGLSYQEALQSILVVRRVVQPNSGFTHQLAWYGRNGCPQTLQESSTGRHYRDIPEFSRLLRRYSAQDVEDLVTAAGASGEPTCTDREALQRALDSLDRLQHCQPEDTEARAMKRKWCSSINKALDTL